MNKYENIKRGAMCIISAIFCCFVLTSCSSTHKEIGEISEKSEYIVIYSRSREKSGGVFCVNGDGTIANRISKFEMQDLSFYSFDEKNLLISGGRSNNNLKFDLSQEGRFSEVYWLNEPDYSGVTAVELFEQSSLVIMNGNYTDETYLNLVVEQDFQGNVIHQNIIELYCRDILIEDTKVAFTGKHLEKRDGERGWKASIIEYDLENQKIKQQYDFEQYNCFWEVELYDGLYYCLAEDKSEAKNLICIIDAETKAVLHEIKIDDQLTGLELHHNALYVVGNKGIYVQGSDQQFEPIVTEICAEDSYVNWAYVYDGSYYIFARLQQRMLLKGEYQYGELLRINLDTLEKDITPIKCEKNVIMDDILVFPVQMFE